MGFTIVVYSSWNIWHEKCVCLKLTIKCGATRSFSAPVLLSVTHPLAKISSESAQRNFHKAHLPFSSSLSWTTWCTFGDISSKHSASLNLNNSEACPSILRSLELPQRLSPLAEVGNRLFGLLIGCWSSSPSSWPIDNGCLSEQARFLMNRYVAKSNVKLESYCLEHFSTKSWSATRLRRPNRAANWSLSWVKLSQLVFNSSMRLHICRRWAISEEWRLRLDILNTVVYFVASKTKTRISLPYASQTLA